MMDPNKGTTTSQNSSSVKVAIHNATMSFMQLANYGKFFLLQSTQRGLAHMMIFVFEGSGPYNSKGPLDEDTVQIKSYHFVSSSTPSTATLTVIAALASDVVSMPVDLVLNGLMVCISFRKI
jgi:hypothetical protein